MRNLTLAILGTTVGALSLYGCIEKVGDDCTFTQTCPPTGGSSGSGATGGMAAGGGDGDGDITGGTGGVIVSGCEPACGGDTSVCDEEAGGCVECLKTADCTGALCDTSSNACVECLEPADCSDPEKPVCDSGTCAAACGDNDDCSRFADSPVCDDVSGSCAVCTPGTEQAQCGTKSCDPATLECGPHDRESRGTCRSCVSDSDCESNHQCVPMEYPKGTPRDGGYCLELSGSCNNPHTVIISGRTSLSNVTGQSYCGINEDVTTCEAVRALEGDLRCDSSLEGDVQCWPSSGTIADAVEVPGALCRKFEGIGGDRCTYECGVVTDCLSAGPASVCGEGTLPVPVTPEFCGGKPN